MNAVYLVRKSMETYLGPFNIAELRDQYRAMEFGLQDEIAASFGKWISLDNVPALKRNYPDIAKLVQEDFLGGWKAADSLQKRGPVAERKIMARRVYVQKSSPLKWIVPSVAMLAAALAAVIYLNKDGKLPIPKLWQPATSVEVEQLENYLEKQDLAAFDVAMQEYLVKFLPKITQSRNAYNEWIPYVRLYAFRNNGSIDGLKPKLLRGMETYYAPSDCSQSAWSQYWMEGKSQWQDFADGKLMVNQNWAKILFWDPYWIKRRTVLTGWLEPLSYYLGCVMMARKALAAIATEAQANGDASFVIPSEFDGRLAVIEAIITSQDPPAMENPFGVLGFVSCTESAQSKTEIDMCRIKDSFALVVQKYLKTVSLRNDFRVFMQKNKVFNNESLDYLSKLGKPFKINDEGNEFNYQAENKFYLALLTAQGPSRELIKQLKIDFPEVDFNGF